MRVLTSPTLIWTKAWLFLALGITAAALLVLERPELKTAAYLALAIWAFCRAYYFAFHVLEHYVDREYRYAGLFDFFMRRILKKGKD